MISLSTRIDKVVTQHFRIKAPSCVNPLALIHQWEKNDVVEGWLIGVHDGRNYGWWGPISRQVAHLAKGVFEAIDNRCPSSPTEWARRARQGTRHAHTGLLSVAVGALELACWDLVGQQANAPVWALFGEAKRESIPTYATCFGFGMNDEKFHAPDEFFRLKSFELGQRAYCKILHRLGEQQ